MFKIEIPVVVEKNWRYVIGGDHLDIDQRSKYVAYLACGCACAEYNRLGYGDTKEDAVNNLREQF